ncbi:MAG: sugar-binding domain-containing protein [Candidatus Ornithomonoglobus sp.]
METESQIYNFNYGWHFKLADAFPLGRALEYMRDENGKYFYEKDFKEDRWEQVSVPHTFNDKELFSTRIEDAGANQTRTFSFYRKWFKLPEQHRNKKVIIEFEGIRQSCFLYVNGKMAGFYENGVAPFGFDLTAYIDYDGDNLIAVATDNTSTRNAPFCMAETPNYPDAEPGSYAAELEPGAVEESRKGVGFFWNCNDFNPAIGGLTKNIRLHIKPRVYMTLPLYTNLQTSGTYIFADNFNGDIAEVNIWAEVRNESGADISVYTESIVIDNEGHEIARIISEKSDVPSAALPAVPPLSITPRSAYTKNADHYVPVNDEKKLPATEIASKDVSVIKSKGTVKGIGRWRVDYPYLYTVRTVLYADGKAVDSVDTVTGFRKTAYDNTRGLMINDEPVWLTGYAQRASNEWAAVGAANDWLKDFDARLVRESSANHIRWMHVAACPADIRACDRFGIVCTQPAGDKERESFGRQWKQRVELMRDVIIYFRNSPSIVFWEAGNNAVNAAHMREMRLVKETLDPFGGRYIGCRTLNTIETVREAEYVGTMLNRHAGRFQSELMPITETEYLREESPRRIWDDFSPPDYDYDNVWTGKGGMKQPGFDVHDYTAGEFAIRTAMGYSEFFNDRIGGASGKNLYSGAAALCWTDSIQHGRQSGSENARMSGRVDAVRVKKQSFDVFKVMQNETPEIKILGHWSYPKTGGDNDKYPVKRFNGKFWEKTGEYAYRDPHKKTVYVIGSYPVAGVELIINGETAGVCEKPVYTFVFPFEGIDITQSGYIEARAYGYDGELIASDRIDTAGEPYEIRLVPHTGERGLLADGEDVIFFDVEVLDKNEFICPCCYERIDFELEGPGKFLGGYNSGKYNGYGKHDSVIHQSYVYAECGTNRVFVRAAETAGELRLTAKMKGIKAAVVSFRSVPADTSALSESAVQRIAYSMEEFNGVNKYAFEPISAADKAKYAPEDKTYCKVLINDDEADTHGIKVEYLNDAVYGPIVYIFDRINRVYPGRIKYSYDEEKGRLIFETEGHKIKLEKGHTHMSVDGEESLLNGEPYVNDDGIFIAEISAVASYIEGASAFYDDNVNLYRIIFEY